VNEYSTAWGPLDLDPERWPIDASEIWSSPPARGEGVPMSTRVEGRQKAMVEELVQSGQFRFKTANDVLRTALDYLLSTKLVPHYMMLRTSGGRSSWQTQARIQRLNQDALRLADTSSSIQDIVGAYAALQRNDQSVAAQQYLTDVMSELSAHPDQEWATIVKAGVERNPAVAQGLLKEGAPSVEEWKEATE
jgi:hypothetical protein